MSKQELENKVREIRELQQFIDEAAAEIEALKDAIKNEMTAQGKEEIQVDVFTVRWVPVNSSRLDTAALKKALPDVAKQFTKTATSRRFTIA